MSTILTHESCLLVDKQLAEFSTTHRATVVGAVVLPATSQIVLVQPLRAAMGPKRESLELSLKIPQGGLKIGETAVDAYERDVLVEELGLDPSALTIVHGLPGTMPTMGGQKRKGRSKVFGLMCGLVNDELPPLHPKPGEIAVAGVYDLDVALDIFSIQAGHEPTANRGQRSLGYLSLIANSGLVSWRPNALQI